MLRATRQVLKPGAPDCFFVMSNARPLTDVDRDQLALRDGNEHVVAPEPYDVLMEKAGFDQIDVTDVTAQYAETLEDWKREWIAGEEALTELVGAEDYARRLRNRDLDIANVADGLLARYRVFGVNPDGR